MPEHPRICDYGDSSYRQDFWEGRGRDYEDAVERQVLARLLPKSGRRLLEVGAGFGRISAEYSMYEQVVLLDYSLEQLQYARGQLGDGRYIYVAADAYRPPFQPATFDGATMIRVIHHFEDVPAVLGQIAETICAGGRFILEFANKRNLKSMLRRLVGRNSWSPYTLDAVEFVELNFNFHPDQMVAEVSALGFEIARVVPVSWFRLGLLKRHLPTSLLAGADGILQRTGWRISPSIFFDLRYGESRERGDFLDVNDPVEIFRCPWSYAGLVREGDSLISETGIRWSIRDGIYDFRKPLNDD